MMSENREELETIELALQSTRSYLRAQATSVDTRSPLIDTIDEALDAVATIRLREWFRP